ncbi:TIGR00730 family Rossman fold protein [Marinobacter lutaoensis]|jgi:uncharacterized protein (TIGR00730 family)|uniref:Cytokinin riboside 5'-monophosphate phosphoribohydrolase n=1 Tax=Marinobacter lutaoensis TaxID=135739 RepID=A0A1V2DV69_9GAMM|nr:TIGR00730 family Rossman fold protein [Marinobacter lutaoensis]MBE01759.1 TIGR00730 family Rossman fold protein [Marinobacter sp.]MBI43094.1 TIGR00730 family Rossman fold protein [Oceanospirillales bacterium]NVD34243.1 TIGR00730 family Rossman fold protein [Marinobacter lutaoensis]ONF44380.1 Rossman fold protein, TIGR00730 family [Marinobacter lutaoensis]|tara:strand:- start:1887 stop:2447 length:561 start_codon:yes stop_codon:yes gene_type:complete
MKLAVYCGSREGNDPVFADATRALGRYLAAEGVDVVFGGGHVGLMGILADAVLAGGGRVYGVIPEALRDRELAHSQLTELHVVADMHQRKARMAELADGFLALPGGIGTLEELFEAWTWGQLGFHRKPCGVYDVNGFYEPLFAMARTMQRYGFLAQEYLDMVIRVRTPEAVVRQFRQYTPPREKWR